MRILLLVGWLMLPVVFAAWHYGPGQERVALDAAARTLAEADACVEKEAWAEAVKKYEAALRLLPPAREQQAQEIRLEKAKAQMFCSQLPAAHQDLQGLVAELEEDASADENLLAEAQTALANAQYYMTWLMRLEGEPKARWEPEIEAARQTYRLLAERAEEKGNDKEALKNREDLEASIRLARMDLDELQGLPLPSQ